MNISTVGLVVASILGIIIFYRMEPKYKKSVIALYLLLTLGIGLAVLIRQQTDGVAGLIIGMVIGISIWIFIINKFFKVLGNNEWILSNINYDYLNLSEGLNTIILRVASTIPSLLVSVLVCGIGSDINIHDSQKVSKILILSAITCIFSFFIISITKIATDSTIKRITILRKARQ